MGGFYFDDPVFDNSTVNRCVARSMIEMQLDASYESNIPNDFRVTLASSHENLMKCAHAPPSPRAVVLSG